jgi:hypothetical protein
MALAEPNANAVDHELYTDMRMILDGRVVMPLVVDFDAEPKTPKGKDYDFASVLAATNKLSAAMAGMGFVYGKHYLIDFSGGKGFHFKTAAITAPENYDKKEIERRVAFFLETVGANNLKIDNSIYSDGRLMRLAGSRHNASGLYCFTIPRAAVKPDGTIDYKIEDILGLAANKTFVDTNTSSPELVQHFVLRDLWTRDLTRSVMLPSAAPQKKKIKLKVCPLLGVFLASPDKMKAIWANGKGRYFSDLMQVLPMAGNSVEAVAKVQTTIENIVSEVRPDAHKEGPEYYAQLEPNCKAFAGVCKVAGVENAVCKKCIRYTGYEIEGLHTGINKEGNTYIRDIVDNYVVLIEREYPNMLCQNEMLNINIFGDREMKNDDIVEIYSVIETKYRLSNKMKCQDAITKILSKNKRNPIKEMIDQTQWDNRPRLERILIDLCGCEDSVLTRAMSKMLGLCLVSRVYKPGEKIDDMIILMGAQGSGKSEFCKKLSIMDAPYFQTLRTIEGKDTLEEISTTWVVEMDELSAFRRAADEMALKSFITKTHDRFRPSYGRYVEVRPRTCVFIGTTNETSFLNDPTGGRRWWPIRTAEKCPFWELSADECKNYILQFYSEARAAYAAGVPLRVTDPEALRMHHEAIKSAHESDEWEGIIGFYLQNHDITYLSTFDVWENIIFPSALGRPNMTRGDSIRIHKTLRHMGWMERQIITKVHGRQRCHINPEKTKADNVVPIGPTITPDDEIPFPFIEAEDLKPRFK